MVDETDDYKLMLDIFGLKCIRYELLGIKYIEFVTAFDRLQAFSDLTYRSNYIPVAHTHTHTPHAYARIVDLTYASETMEIFGSCFKN